jgi:hypothetical protein
MAKSKRFKTSAEIAELHAIPEATIKIHMKQGGELYDYITSTGKIDTSRKPVKEFIDNRGRPTVSDALENAKNMLPDATVSMVEIAEKPFGEVVAMFGTDSRMKGWLDAVKKIEDVAEKRLKNSKAREEVVERSLVEKHVFSYLNTIQSRVLNDLPKTLSIKVENAVNTGSTLEDLETLIRNDISSHYKKVKQKVMGVISSE